MHFENRCDKGKDEMPCRLRALLMLNLCVARTRSVARLVDMTLGRRSGRKRHIVVDTVGLLMVAVVTAANVQDRDGGKQILRLVREKFSWCEVDRG
jgi:hypothetical protein